MQGGIPKVDEPLAVKGRYTTDNVLMAHEIELKCTGGFYAAVYTSKAGSQLRTAGLLGEALWRRGLTRGVTVPDRGPVAFTPFTGGLLTNLAGCEIGFWRPGTYYMLCFDATLELDIVVPHPPAAPFFRNLLVHRRIQRS